VPVPNNVIIMGVLLRFIVVVGMVLLSSTGEGKKLGQHKHHRKALANERSTNVLSSKMTTIPNEDGDVGEHASRMLGNVVRPLVSGVSSSMRRSLAQVTHNLVSKLAEFVDDTLSGHTCDYNCIISVINRAEKHIGGSHPSNGVDLMAIIDDARRNLIGSDPNIVKLAFGLIADVVYASIHIIVPDLRTVVLDKWSEIRKESEETLGDVVPGGALAMRSTSILDDVREILEMKTREPVQEICHMLPEVGVNLGVMADVPLGEYCVIVSSHLIDMSLSQLAYGLVRILDRAKEKFRDQPLVQEGIDLVEHVMSNPVGSVVREFTGKIRTDTGEITTTLVSKVKNAVEGVLERAKSDSRASAKKKAIIRELEEEVEFLYASDCSVKHERLPEEIICEIDKAIFTGTVLLDKQLLWSQIIESVRSPLQAFMQRLSKLMDRASKMVKQKIESVSSDVQDASDSTIRAIEDAERNIVRAHPVPIAQVEDPITEGIKLAGEHCEDHAECESGNCFDMGFGGKCTA